ELLLEAGRDAEAVEEGEALLDLDGQDAMGLRYRLVGAYLSLRKVGAYRRLRKRFAAAGSAFFRWGDVLAALHDDEPAAFAALRPALRAQPRVPELLLSPWTL